jgi:hypothetical protein
MVRFIPLNITDEDSVEYVLSHVDNSMQYGEDLEPKVKYYYFNILAYYTNTCSFRNLMMLKNTINKKKKKLQRERLLFDFE